MMHHTDVIVIGGGQAGLALGHELARQGTDFVILDASPSVGHAWRSRWDSLVLFTPAQYSGLPGMAFPAPPDTYPTKDAVADYLAAYAATFDLPVCLNSPVRHVRRAAGGYVVHTPTAAYAAAQVVVATGAFHTPFVPALASELAPEVAQLHSSAYRNPAQIADGEVLVVGAGNTGAQIAEELARTHRVTLAVGQSLPALPQRLMGRDIGWWLRASGAMSLPVDSWLGRRASARDALIGTSLRRLRALGVRVAGRAQGARSDAVLLAGWQVVRPRTVIWATGFRNDYSWIDAPVLDMSGRPVHRRGVTAAPGLFFLGLPWQHTRGSALIGGVGDDAAYLAGHIARQVAAARPAARAA
ncbi:MAG TPA: NAD(P)/FAD-dependent oxidoreductase [Roseiflexaceae bacterium]|nr:NAD(P)/FAD-dependent oxidoreductase [Roseiflexaceae bacterium]